MTIKRQLRRYENSYILLTSFVAAVTIIWPGWLNTSTNLQLLPINDRRQYQVLAFSPKYSLKRPVSNHHFLRHDHVVRCPSEITTDIGRSHHHSVSQLQEGTNNCRQRQEKETQPAKSMPNFAPFQKISISIQSLALSLLVFGAPLFVQPEFSSAGMETANTDVMSSNVAAPTTITATNPTLSGPSISASQSQPTLNNRSRYWNMINSNDAESIIIANERLMDYAVGTINTMYYDNSGGAFFSPKDLYDRWRILRVYAKDGLSGVKDLVSYSDVKNVNSIDGNDKDSDRKSGTTTTFKPQIFVVDGDAVKVKMNHWDSTSTQQQSLYSTTIPSDAFSSRENVVSSLKWLVSTLDDPYSAYLTREELQNELKKRDDGFLGLGIIVEGPQSRGLKSTGGRNANSAATTVDLNSKYTPQSTNTVIASSASVPSKTKGDSTSTLLTLTGVSNLPTVTAIVPNSPAERAGIIVGDRIAAIGSNNFLGLGADDVVKKLNVYTGAENYFGYPELTIAKPIYRTLNLDLDSDTNGNDDVSNDNTKERNMGMSRDEVMGYKLSRARLPTMSILSELKPRLSNVNTPPPAPKEGSILAMSEILPSASAALTSATNTKTVSGGDSIVQYELLTPNDSIFRKYASTTSNSGIDLPNDAEFRSTDKVGYIRLTRFSKSSTSGWKNAVEELEKAGAQSYIIDVRNNYGGVIQESMLTASTLLRDPHTVLCYTMNSRGGFTPHDAEEYIVDTRYPGYLLSREPRDVTIEQVKLESPNFVSGEGWIPPSAYASIREQRMNRNISRITFNPFGENSKQQIGTKPMEELKQFQAQKKVVILMNEGTASAAEVFVSSLHDNGRTVATIGTKTYGKGLIQHTFPLQDGGGLRLTVAEYLTPALQHVTKVGSAQYDRITGEYVGGGVKPDIFCPSNQGIPSNTGADICVGMALDALEDADAREMEVAASLDYKRDDMTTFVERRGGIDGGAGKRKKITQGLMPDDF